MESKMVGQREKKKGQRSRDVEKALVPKAVFTAVPHSRTVPASMTAPSTSGLIPKSQTVTSPPRLLGQPQSPKMEFSDPESSLFDYQQMDEAGYATVGFGTWPNKGRQKKDVKPDMPKFRQAVTVGGYAEPGYFQDSGGGDSPRITAISDIYATPKKKKGKKTSRIVAEEDRISMTATQQDVRTEMKKIHDLSSEVSETMSRNERHSVQAYPDSGRGSTRPDSLVDADVNRDHDLAHIADEKMVVNHKTIANVMATLEARPGEVAEDDEKKQLGLIDNQTLEGLLKASRNGGGNLHGQISSHFSHSRTSGSAGGFASDMEVQELRMKNTELLGEVRSLRQVAEAIRDGDVEGAQTLHIRKQLEEMRDENETLKKTVHRLNIELSEYQAKHRPVDPAQLKQVIEINGLPLSGPIPSWLISMKYLTPLFLAYDDHLAEKDKVIEECKRELASVKKRVEEILKGNQRLRIAGASELGGPGDSTEWQQLQEQARLVLEENQILMEQLEVQTNKSRDMYSAHISEISRLAKKLTLSEAEKANTEQELDELRVQFRDLKRKHDQIVMESSSQVNVHTHINTIADLKKSVTEEKEQVDREIDSLRVKLKASEEERKRQALQLIDLTAENKQLKVEVKAVHKSVRHSQQKMAVLHRAIELSEDKEMMTQEQLANVIKVAEKTALERDTVYKVAREQQEESKMTVNKMLQGSVTLGKLEEKLKLYRIKASAKLNTVAEKLSEQDEAFNSQKKEYEREIQHLRLLLREKEEIIESLEQDKKDIEQDLHTMWQAASSENNRVKTLLYSGTRKLKDQAHIADALQEEMEAVELLHLFHDDDSHKERVRKK